MTRKITECASWVGYVDWPVRNFHGYTTSRGSTYNAYVVKAGKTVLVDAVKAPYADKLIENVRSVAPDGLDYVVCNHAEPDHSGALPAVMAAYPGATLVTNAKCLDALSHHYDTAGWKTKIVNEGDTLDIGGKTLKFFMTPMAHWPESMVTYLPEEELLFSMDIFGQHYASSARFDTEADLAEVFQEAKTYYANIVLLYARPAAAALKKLSGLAVRTVCPSHGVIWTSHLPEIIERYKAWAVSRPEKKVVVAYGTMWGSTRKMAEKIAEGAMSRGTVEVKLIDLGATDDTDVVRELMDCGAFAVGSPTLNMGILPRVARTLTYVRGLRPADKTAFAFGSYGWGSKGAEEAEGYLTQFGCKIARPPLTVRFAPDAETLAACFEAGAALADAAAAAADGAAK